MNWIAAIVLLAAAYFLFEAGLGFLAFLTLAALIIMLILTPEGKHHHARGKSGAPTIIESGGEEIPGRINIKIKPNWMDRWSGEYLMEHLGYGMDNLGRGIVYLLTGKKGTEK